MIDKELINKSLREFVGTRVVRALSMTRGTYNDFRGWELPKDENDTDWEMLLVTPNATNNVEGIDGHVSWVPKELFYDMYRPVVCYGWVEQLRNETNDLHLRVAPLMEILEGERFETFRQVVPEDVLDTIEDSFQKMREILREMSAKTLKYCVHLPLREFNKPADGEVAYIAHADGSKKIEEVKWDKVYNTALNEGRVFRTKEDALVNLYGIHYSTIVDNGTEG